jgi:hypothetical protein
MAQRVGGLSPGEGQAKPNREAHHDDDERDREPYSQIQATELYVRTR